MTRPSDISERIMARLLALAPADGSMELPPRVFVDMDGEFIDYVEGESLTARFPNKSRYANPFGYMQGGIIGAAIDNTVSSLSYALTAPNLTKSLSTQYRRPVTGSDEFIDVIASLAERTEAGVVMRAEVRTPNGKLVATAEAQCVYIKHQREVGP